MLTFVFSSHSHYSEIMAYIRGLHSIIAHMQSHKTIDVVFWYSHCALDMFHHSSVWKFATQPIKTSTICSRVWFKHFLHNSIHNWNGNSIKPWADRIFNRIHYMLTPFSTYCLHMIHKMHFTSTISTNTRKYQHHSPTVHVAELTGYYISHSKPLITHIDSYWILWTCYLITVCPGFSVLFSCMSRVLFEHCLNHHIRLRANIKSFPFDLFLEYTALNPFFQSY